MESDYDYSWPPQRIPWDTDWEVYLEQIYAIYSRTFNWDNRLYFDGMPVRTRRYPIENGKDNGFWHIIGGENGEPDKERCERIIWARVLIENCNNDEILVWSEPSRHDGSVVDVVLWAKNLDYYVVLAKRNGYWVLRTAYDIKYDTKREKLESAYSKYGPYKTRIASLG